LPLYDGRDVETTMKLFRDAPLGEWFSPAEPIWMRYHDAGHLLGSTMIEVEIREGKKPLRILFSGDVGRYGGPLYHDPAPPPACDYLICESTYGNREHPEESLLDGLEQVVHRSISRGGVMLMAAFAVGRAQQLIYLLQILKSADRIPDLPIYLDSPMACDATAVYREFANEHDLSDGALDPAHPALAGRKVILARSSNESKAINQTRGPAVIIASSGMMTGGRIVHHLQQRLPYPENTLVLGGFQALGTRGRQIEDGAEFIRMFGRDVAVRAAVEKVPGLSGHADRSDLLRWLDHLPQPPKKTFLTHGEPDAADAFAADLRQRRGWNVEVPALGATADLV
jgi:metallo-beta-lactamase family protein